MSKLTYQQRGNQNSRIPISQRRMEGGRALEDNRTVFAAKQLKQGETAQRVEEEDELVQGKSGAAQLAKDDEEETAQAKFSNLAPPVQREEQPAKPNNTGLPDNLKNGVESLSGLSMDNVKVHYNSAKPQQLNALAYAQGTNIHIGPGQEQHLPHEAWHVVQQAQGRVKPTMQMKGVVPINDDNNLEAEADVAGRKALQMRTDMYNAGPEPAYSSHLISSQHFSQDQPFNKTSNIEAMPSLSGVVQRLLIPFKSPAVPDADEANVIIDANTIDAITTAAYTNTWDRINASVAPLNPVPLDIAQFPGASEGHFTFMIDQLQGTNDTLKAAAVGYVIEDQVTNGGIPGTVDSQVGVGNAIPDFVSTHNGARGVIDVTSSGQIGHVMDKAFNKATFAYIGEATYQSIDFGAFGGVAPMLGGAAAALAQQAKQRRANAHIGSVRYQILQHIQLYSEGIKSGDVNYQAEKENLRNGILGLPNDAIWTGMQINNIDQLIANLNAQLDANFHVPSLTQIITDTQNNYLVPGNPMWP